MRHVSRALLIIMLFCRPLPGSAQAGADIGSLIAGGKKFEQHRFTDKAATVYDFAIMDPGIAIVPVSGGLLAAGWNKWLLPPGEKNIPYAVDYVAKDTIFYTIRTNGASCSLSRFQTVGDEPYLTKVLDLPLNVYGLRCAAKDAIYLWSRKDEKSAVYLFDLKAAKTVYTTDRIIKEVIPINAREILVAEDSCIVRMGLDYPPREIICADTVIDGLAISYDGTLFVSTPAGILHYFLPEYESDMEVVTYGIHGLLRRHKKSLYVLWKENGQVLEIKL